MPAITFRDTHAHTAFLSAAMRLWEARDDIGHPETQAVANLIEEAGGLQGGPAAYPHTLALSAELLPLAREIVGTVSPVLITP